MINTKYNYVKTGGDFGNRLELEVIVKSLISPYNPNFNSESIDSNVSTIVSAVYDWLEIANMDYDEYNNTFELEVNVNVEVIVYNNNPSIKLYL